MGEANGVGMMQEELAWDHAAENTPLLQDSAQRNPFIFSSQTDAHLLLSGRHIDQLLRNLDDSATLLKNVLKSSTRLPPEHTATSRICSSRVRSLCQCSVTSVLWVTIGIQLLSATLVTILDATGNKHDTATASMTIMSILQAVNLIYYIFASVILTRRMSFIKGNSSFCIVLKSYISSILLFVGLYTLTYRVQATSWASPVRSLEGSSALSMYVKMVYVSIATATLSGSVSVIPSAWVTYLTTSIQMLLSLAYLMQMLRLAIRWQQQPTPMLQPVYPVYGTSPVRGRSPSLVYPVYGTSPIRGRSPSLVSRSSLSSNTGGSMINYGSLPSSIAAVQ